MERVERHGRVCRQRLHGVGHGRVQRHVSAGRERRGGCARRHFFGEKIRLNTAVYCSRCRLWSCTGDPTGGVVGAAGEVAEPGVRAEHKEEIAASCGNCRHWRRSRKRGSGRRSGSVI
ncbi:hypothetical protein AMAG_19080 [Allomyces macrogynus ATCC 38327]|uniref:Uncharacterized protein n=1 Tax=Allomyces macrogynus (strain ATCC 38327) TaxID=578462 RepID=A0A0L0SMZ9_ALLM3|nr:hypothetical protein AMAG_19080 [Allomyces macrogynus ATCC 38327]|eukprot:KNE63862.1 hypothetical protein AMAG_19080 [Allomyces macrogynus ATCC 38327]